ncbi:MAG: hypothetical protein KDA41_06635 [Planctomycetales bacterium]|nr:hypothetical protein [Planctomycetales bacterium]
MLLTGLALWTPPSDAPRRPAADAPAAPPPVGHVVPVPLPLVGSADQAVRVQIRRILQKAPAGPQPPVIILQFGADDEQTGAGSEFGRSYELARFLLSEELGSAYTVAYLPHRLEGHALLPAMACKEIVMRQEAAIGRAGGEGVPLSNVERDAYEEIYQQRQTLPAALAIGAIDPRVSVIRANVKTGARWILGDDLAEVQKEPGYAGHDEIVKANEAPEFSAEELRGKYGFVSRVVADRAELAAVLKVSRLTEDPTLGAEWNAIRIDLHGPIHEDLIAEAKRAIKDKLDAHEAAGHSVNFICLHIDSPGGSPGDSISLINYLEALDRGRVFVVAYAPRLARGDAAMIAMACDRVTLGPNAVLGGSGAAFIDEQDAADLIERVKAISKARGGHWSLWAAMVDRRREVFRYTQAGTNREIFLSPDEHDQMRDKDQWRQGEPVDGDQTLLQVDGQRAVELGLAENIAENDRDFLRLYGLENQPELARRSWAHQVIERTRRSILPGLLVFIGSIALLIEMSAPGVGLPGFVALVCFVLYFWIMVLNGTATSLEILLFVAGMLCLAAEIFILPGFGVFGLGGGVMVVISLVLASQTFVIPRNEYQFDRLPVSLFTVVAAGAGVIAGAVIARRYFHRTPGLSAMMLEPPDEAEQQERSRREALVDFAYLYGKRGTAATPLMPSGKARFGDDVVDVVARGDAVAKGSGVIVVEVQGNVVVVEGVG